MAQLITQAGFSGAIGGTVTVYGTLSSEAVQIIDEPGTVKFDASFNRGGDLIIFPKAAQSYNIIRSGSSVLISDGDTHVFIPVGTSSNIIQFADGDRALGYDGTLKIGGQVIDAVARTITALPNGKSSLPVDTSPMASRLIMNGEAVTVAGKVSVFGNVASETVTVLGASSEVSFDASFNRGGDKVVLTGAAENYQAVLSGSSVVLRSATGQVTLPVGVKGADVSFGEDSRVLIYGNGKVYLGNQVISGREAAVNSFETNLVYSEVTNAFSAVFPFSGNATSNRPVIADLNGDGYLDLLYWWSEDIYTGARLGEVATGKPMVAQLQFLINDQGRGFTDETSKFIANATVDGGTDSFVVHDFNADGIPDIVFATSREDGRNTDNPKDATNQLTALMSNKSTGQYDVVKFAQNAWYFHIGSFDINGATYIAAVGSMTEKDTQEVFRYKDGNFTLVDGLFPARSGSDPWQPFKLGSNYIFFDKDGDGSADTLIDTNGRGLLLVNGVKTDIYTSGLDGYLYNSKENSWTHAGSYFPMNEKTYIKDVKFISWNLNENVQPVFEQSPGVYSVRTDVFITSDLINLRPAEAPVFMAVVNTTLLYSDNIKAVTQINEWDLVPRAYVAFFDIIDGKLQKVPAVVHGLENIDLYGANYISALDFNHDGYQDIVISTWDKVNFPLVFINNKHNEFFRLERTVQEESYNSSLFFADFNNDGLVDILSYIADGQQALASSGHMQFKYFVASADVSFG